MVFVQRNALFKAKQADAAAEISRLMELADMEQMALIRERASR